MSARAAVAPAIPANERAISKYTVSLLPSDSTGGPQLHQRLNDMSLTAKRSFLFRPLLVRAESGQEPWVRRQQRWVRAESGLEPWGRKLQRWVRAESGQEP